MDPLRPKLPRLALDAQHYKALRRQVLNRDGWKCQACGWSNDLHVHHVKARSRLGDDTTDNLITLCASCHESLHGRR
jgi:5-methylcytosine-specific restriction endonuclease McrA